MGLFNNVLCPSHIRPTVCPKMGRNRKNTQIFMRNPSISGNHANKVWAFHNFNRHFSAVPNSNSTKLDKKISQFFFWVHFSKKKNNVEQDEQSRSPSNLLKSRTYFIKCHTHSRAECVYIRITRMNQLDDRIHAYIYAINDTSYKRSVRVLFTFFFRFHLVQWCYDLI